MLNIALFLLLVWAVAIVLGIVVKGLKWLLWAGIVLAVATGIWVFVLQRE